MRNKNVDIIRALALSIVIIYHIWIISGSREIGFDVIKTFIHLGGELGVTVFFILSGYGIYHSLNRTLNRTQNKSDEKRKISYKEFLKKRIIRIAPEYYISLLFMLLMVGGCSWYISKEGLFDIISHLLFIHNLFPNHAGTINGVLWTMGDIVQFYIVAIPLYFCMKKNSIVTLALSGMVTVFCKFFLLGRLLPSLGLEYQFWASRNFFFSVLDNFVIGMFVAHVLLNWNIKKFPKFVDAICSVLLLAVIYLICKLGETYGIHTPNWSGYIWHSLIALAFGMLIFFVSRIEVKENGIYKFFLWISKYEYTTYILHLIMIQTLLGASPFIQWLNNGGIVKYISCFVVLYFLSLGMGYIFSKMVDGIREIIQHE